MRKPSTRRIERDDSDESNSEASQLSSPTRIDPRKVLSKAFRCPLVATQDGQNLALAPSPRSNILGVRRRTNLANRPLHDPDAEDAIILYAPNEEDAMQGENGEDDAPMDSLKRLLGLHRDEAAKEVHVVLDPMLVQVLRPHQVEGVRFLYECATGLKVENAYGCIMADEMGLGKTLQCITLLWTLLRQSPNPRKPTIEKCLIACPSSLVKNWANELVKWLKGRLNPIAIDGRGTKEKVLKDLDLFASGHGRSNGHPVLIVSYETLRCNIKALEKTPIGLLLCDEGHRLKNSNSLTFQALDNLNVQRRVILSGTPIQNDLSEYFSLLNFANPGLLGTTSEFRRRYETPILRGRDADATEDERKLSDERLQELTSLANRFIIRRTNDLLSKYLPTKYEHVVFCRMGSLQQRLYKQFTSSPAVRRLLESREDRRSTPSGTSPLQIITRLKKLCNDPALLDLPAELDGSEEILPKGWRRTNLEPLEGKMLVLDRLLRMIKDEGDKIVLISNYTQTLDRFAQLCGARRHGFLRLDGTMTVAKRQQLVDQFNKPDAPEFVFLLSSKAGGCGLNLIGANRLVLFDPDWNPASDQQALARVWRDGQRKTCFIYRLIAAGTIEEKIFQRQSHKQSLSSCVVDEAEDVERHFSLENMRRLFQLNETSQCETHDTFKCRRCVAGRMVKDGDMNYGDASTWSHYNEPELHKLADPLLKRSGKGLVSFVFQYKSHEGAQA
ncbi:P-loop containing nucleoside triphosphate hydrolase protein [Thamnocephalis sphaerospora]|uniref:P-loop containing nucleoside triphosphate hydrolase protein n=1 Tax=Thamnocephalis sphaerospora TaxID=78915 RepID=A0A4P9XQR0_9FUNG|nr:P-loop containing nucleoside triphosphate hydrolase protein [Thamnocephalis sphaerospora]|eukprot:RKP08376.1 P-loop containing nucleoside triphosphate hydrolase protein [Thamnocephalis sphaerospora]